MWCNSFFSGVIIIFGYIIDCYIIDVFIVNVVVWFKRIDIIWSYIVYVIMW